MRGSPFFVLSERSVAAARAARGLGLDKIRAFSRHRTIATLMMYVDEHDREQTQRTLGDLVAGALVAPR
jgi:hypothetical protein